MKVPQTRNLGLDMSVWLTFKPPGRILSRGTHRKFFCLSHLGHYTQCTAVAGSLVLSY
jgi:hypothetical protein